MEKRDVSIATVAALCIAALLLIPSAAHAACAGPAKGEKRDFYRQALKDADGAITGKVLRRRKVESSQEGSTAFTQEYVVVYRIGRLLKAKRQLGSRTRLRIRSSGSEALWPRVGSRSGLLLYRSRGKWTSSGCGRVPKRALRRAAS